jgi:hypothetical protein
MSYSTLVAFFEFPSTNNANMKAVISFDWENILTLQSLFYNNLYVSKAGHLASRYKAFSLLSIA